jgi:hypothetical protein
MSEAECRREEVGQGSKNAKLQNNHVPWHTRMVNAPALPSALFSLVSAFSFSVALERHSLYLAADEFC